MQHTNKSPAKKRRPWWLRFLIALLTLLVVFVAGTFLLVNSMLNKMNRPDLSEFATQSEYKAYTLYDAVQDGPDLPPEQFVVMEPGDIDWTPANQIHPGKDIVNILLIGQDRRSNEGRQRADTMMLVTFNQEDTTITLTSFLRDLYVSIPGYGYNRLNAAYTFGGMSLLDQTLSENFGVTINGNLEVDFASFVDVFDTLGGVDVTISPAEAEIVGVPGSGAVHLNGTQALAYSRIRSLDSDFGRTARQRAVMTSAFHQLRGLSLTEAYRLIDVLLPKLTTDLSNAKIMQYAVTLLPTAADATLTTQHIPAENDYSYATIDGMAVIVPDFDACRGLLYRTLGGDA